MLNAFPQIGIEQNITDRDLQVEAELKSYHCTSSLYYHSLCHSYRYLTPIITPHKPKVYRIFLTANDLQNTPIYSGQSVTENPQYEANVT
jgi:hypothetical protein